MVAKQKGGKWIAQHGQTLLPTKSATNHARIILNPEYGIGRKTPEKYQPHLQVQPAHGNI
jgi:hypothetical protein